MVRSQAADYGFQLNEFDPFFNYRATQYLVDNGVEAYYAWDDDLAWHPDGRNVSATSQTMLHLTAGLLYSVFGGGSSVYDFTIVFPVVFGAFTAIVIFALVRVIGGTTAGLFAALFFSISPALIVRGTLGWFKSEPLGLFYGLLAVYLFLSGIKSQNKKIAFGKIIGAGMFLAFGLGSWGGIQFFVIPLGIFVLALPFLRKDHNFLLWAIPLFSFIFLLTTSSFERPGINFILGLGGFSIIGPTAFLVACIFIQKFSKDEKKIRNGLFFLIAVVLGGTILLAVNAEDNFLPLPSFRYLNAINPFLTTSNALVDSVAEHATTTTAQSFWFTSVLMIFAGIGVWLIFQKRAKGITYKINNDMIGFALILGLIGVYVSSAFVRLEVFAAISVIILSSIGLAILTTEFFKPREFKGKKPKRETGPFIKISYVVVIIVLLIIPTTVPVNGNWINGVKAPPTILNGGTNFNVASDDWLAALDWLKNNTPADSSVAAWWDYGYWITTLAERKSLADNATLDPKKIETIAKMFLSPPDDAWKQLQDLDADYVLVFVAARHLPTDPPIYLLNGGGDESKKAWFMRIAGEDESKFVGPDGLTGTDLFWEETILGKMFPFSIFTYVNPANNQQSATFIPGYTAVYQKEVKYPADGDGPLKMVYASPSYEKDNVPVIGVFIYEVNKNYTPILEEKVIPSSTQEERIGVITTSFGDITIQFKDDVAPKTVENFVELANSGFYDGTIFHRIEPGFVIQGGDPNTKSGPPETWGIGGPGYSIEPEFSSLKHTKYLLSMARGSDIGSAGSQFFIMLGDAPWLDGQYTIFGEVSSGQEIVDEIASLETNELSHPTNLELAKMIQVKITNP